MIGPDFIRAAGSDEVEEIDELLVAAFRRPDEAELVKRLRSDGDLWYELVIPWEGAIAGYAALSYMRAPERWACLAPLAVHPRFQRAAAAPDKSIWKSFSIGTRLAQGIALMMERPPELDASGNPAPITVVVVGRPEFYERAGFSSVRAKNLISPYGVHHTLIARPGHDAPTETLAYPLAFDALE